MATSKPAIDTAPKRSPNLKPRTSPAMPAITTVRKPETAGTRRNISAPVPLSPSSTKRSTAISSKPVITSNTSRVISPKPKKNPSLAVAPEKDRIHGTRAHKEGVLSPKPPSPKPRTESATTRAGTGVRTGTRVVNASAPVRGRSLVTGTKTVSKVGAAAAAAKPASKRSPSVGAKTGTRGSLTRVHSAPNLLKQAANIVHEEKVTDIPAEAEKNTEVMSPDIEIKDDQTELIPVPVPVPVPVPSLMEEELKEEHVHVRIQNDGQSETYAENEVHEDEEEPTDEVTSEPATAEPVPVQTVPVPDVSVPEVPIPDAPVPVVPVPAAQVATVTTAHGKKEAGTSNAAIEETRSKLIGERKSKVLALVGAFESVM